MPPSTWRKSRPSRSVAIALFGAVPPLPVSRTTPGRAIHALLDIEGVEALRLQKPHLLVGIPRLVPA